MVARKINGARHHCNVRDGGLYNSSCRALSAISLVYSSNNGRHFALIFLRVVVVVAVVIVVCMTMGLRERVDSID
jgi:uncharacterized membrane protein